MKTDIKLAVVKKERILTKLKSVVNPGPIAPHTSAEWTQIQNEHLVNLFKKAADSVPAYKKFLKTNKINPDSVSTISDFSSIPPVNKNNYLRANSFKELL